MTLIVTLANRTQVIQISDRRLSSLGEVVTDCANKATSFECVDGRFAVGFTGLARSGRFDIESWLVDALGDCAPPDFLVREVVERLASRLTSLFVTHPDIKRLPAEDRRLTVMLSGYALVGRHDRIGSILVSNFQSSDAQDSATARAEFQVVPMLLSGTPAGGPSLVQWVGAWPAMVQADADVLGQLLDDDAPSRALIDAAVGLMRKAARRPAAGKTVGDEMAVIIIPGDSRLPTEAQVRLATGTNRILSVNVVRAMPPDHGGTVQIRDLTISVAPTPGSGPVFKKKQGRNERCHCGSGRKYKACHGRPQGPG